MIINKKDTPNNFQECAQSGGKIQESYPEVCITDDNKRYVNPDQQAPSLP